MDPNKLTGLHEEKVGDLEECTALSAQEKNKNTTTTRFIGRLTEGVQELKREQ